MVRHAERPKDGSPPLGQLVEQDALEVPVRLSRSSQERTAVHRAPWLGAETRVFCGVALGCRNKPRASKKMVRSRSLVGDPSRGGVGLAGQQAVGTWHYQVQWWC